MKKTAQVLLGLSLLVGISSSADVKTMKLYCAIAETKGVRESNFNQTAIKALDELNDSADGGLYDRKKFPERSPKSHLTLQACLIDTTYFCPVGIDLNDDKGKREDIFKALGLLTETDTRASLYRDLSFFVSKLHADARYSHSVSDYNVSFCLGENSEDLK